MARTRRAKPRRSRHRGAGPGPRPAGTAAGRTPAGRSPAGRGAGASPAPGALAAIPRIALVDWLRGAALVGMTVFHFAYDLEFFGLEERGFSKQAHWSLLATAVAGSFLFLAGASLFLAHSHAVRWRPFGRRLATVALAALAISAVTWFVTPRFWIFFGILHMIAVASIAGLAFVRAPWWCAAAAGAAVLAVDRLVVGALPDSLPWYWIGLSGTIPATSDFRPVFPWLAPALFGVAAAKWCAQRDWLGALARPRLEGRMGRGLRLIGRHSLLFYLLHQPVLFALFWAWLRLAGR